MQDVTYVWQVERYSQGFTRSLGAFSSVDEAKQVVLKYVSTDPSALRWERMSETNWRLIEGDGAFTCYTVERWFTPPGESAPQKG